jgi:hypothetical protein
MEAASEVGDGPAVIRDPNAPEGPWAIERSLAATGCPAARSLSNAESAGVLPDVPTLEPVLIMSDLTVLPS